MAVERAKELCLFAFKEGVRRELCKDAVGLDHHTGVHAGHFRPRAACSVQRAGGGCHCQARTATCLAVHVGHLGAVLCVRWAPEGPGLGLAPQF